MFGSGVSRSLFELFSCYSPLFARCGLFSSQSAALPHIHFSTNPLPTQRSRYRFRRLRVDLQETIGTMRMRRERSEPSLRCEHVRGHSLHGVPGYRGYVPGKKSETLVPVPSLFTHVMSESQNATKKLSHSQQRVWAENCNADNEGLRDTLRAQDAGGKTITAPASARVLAHSASAGALYTRPDHRGSDDRKDEYSMALNNQIRHRTGAVAMPPAAGD